MANKEFTALEVYGLTKNKIFEGSSSRDFDNDWLVILNMALSDLFDFNNAYRLAEDKEELEDVPYLENETDIVPYEYQVVMDLVVIYMAREFMRDDDLSKFNLFETQYANNYQRLIKLDTLDTSSDEE